MKSREISFSQHMYASTGMGAGPTTTQGRNPLTEQYIQSRSLTPTVAPKILYINMPMSSSGKSPEHSRRLSSECDKLRSGRQCCWGAQQTKVTMQILQSG